MSIVSYLFPWAIADFREKLNGLTLLCSCRVSPTELRWFTNAQPSGASTLCPNDPLLLEVLYLEYLKCGVGVKVPDYCI